MMIEQSCECHLATETKDHRSFNKHVQVFVGGHPSVQGQERFVGIHPCTLGRMKTEDILESLAQREGGNIWIVTIFRGWHAYSEAFEQSQVVSDGPNPPMSGQ